MKYNSKSTRTLSLAHPELLGPLERWRESPEISKQHRHRYGAVALLLAALPRSLTTIDNRLLAAAGTEMGKGAAYVADALGAARAFLAWAKSTGALPCELDLRKVNPHTYKSIPLPDEIRAEIDSILAEHLPHGRPVMPKYVRRCIDEVSAIYSFIKEMDRERTFTSLANLTKKDLVDYQKRLQVKGSAVTGEALAPKTIFNKMDVICSLIKVAVEQDRAGYSADVIEGFKRVKVEKKGQADRYRPREVVAKLVELDLEAAERLPLERRFIEVRDAAMTMCQYDAALRCEDLTRLTTDAVLYAETTVGGLLPFRVIGGKARSRDCEERLHFTPPAVEYLEYYMKVRAEYCAAMAIAVRPTRDRKSSATRILGVPVFITEKGEAMSESAYRDAFKRRAARAGIKLRDGEATHLLRHSRISHWVEDGLPIDVVKELARHKDIKQTMEYYHYQPDRGRGKLEAHYGRRPAGAGSDPLPELRAVEFIVAQTMKSLGITKTLAETQRIARELRNESDPNAYLGEVYTVPEVCELLNRGRTQVYEMVNKNILKARRLENGKLAFPREEIDRIAAMRTAAQVSMALGLRARSRLHVMSKEGQIEAVDWCGELRFTDKAIVDCAISRNTHKIALGTRLKRPASLQMGFGADRSGAKAGIGEFGPVAFSNGASKDPKSTFKPVGAP